MCPSSVWRPSTMTASTSSPITRRWIGSHTGSRLRYGQGWLLQSAVGWSTKVCYRPVAVGHECCSASCERHEEVRPRLDTPASLWEFEKHWLDVADRVTYKLVVTVYKCLHGQAPHYLSELCTPVAQVAERQHLRSASRHPILVVPRLQLDTYGCRTFSVAGSTTWNLFQNNLREPDMQIDCFLRTLKTFLVWTVLGTSSALEALFCDDVPYELTLTVTFTYITVQFVGSHSRVTDYLLLLLIPYPYKSATLTILKTLLMLPTTIE